MNHDDDPSNAPRSNRAIFLAALELVDEHQRRSYLDRACCGDAERRNEIERLLAVHDAGQASPLDRIVAQLGSADASRDVTHLLSQMEAGDPRAAEQLLPLVYDELRKLAGARLAQENPGQTLQATALVHEAYLRLLGPAADPACWNGREHFFGAAAEAMRRILVEHARRKKSQRRGGNRQRLKLLEDVVSLDFDENESDRILAVDEALTELEAISSRQAQLVKLRFFSGMTLEEAATALQVSVPTAKRDWAKAKVWLYRWLKNTERN